jgi:hypothetical protein
MTWLSIESRETSDILGILCSSARGRTKAALQMGRDYVQPGNEVKYFSQMLHEAPGAGFPAPNRPRPANSPNSVHRASSVPIW